MDTPVKIQTRKPVWWWIATWFGSGLSPVASGTAGSLAALPFAYVIQVTLGNAALFAASIIIFLIGWWAAAQFVRKMPGKSDDPGEIVVDEVAGQWLLLSVLFPTWQSYLVGFFLFRFFDIMKPWPVSVADRKLKGGFGVMFDDMLAALYPILVYLIIMLEAQLLHGQNLLVPITRFLAGSYVHR
jgi:phosphatidylglycerophosphatase A